MRSQICHRLAPAVIPVPLALLILAAGLPAHLMISPARAESIATVTPHDPDTPAGSPFLLKKTEARAVVTGPVANVVVTQTWENPNATPVDGLYIFPLPEDAAVTDMSLLIGDRRIEGGLDLAISPAPPGG